MRLAGRCTELNPYRSSRAYDPLSRTERGQLGSMYDLLQRGLVSERNATPKLKEEDMKNGRKNPGIPIHRHTVPDSQPAQTSCLSLFWRNFDIRTRASSYPAAAGTKYNGLLFRLDRRLEPLNANKRRNLYEWLNEPALSFLQARAALKQLGRLIPSSTATS